MTKPFEVECADIEWCNGDTPYSPRFSDTYYSRAGGLDESNYVFIDQNRIRQHLSSRSVLKIAELGFGSGLNFLLCWNAWSEVASSCTLDYVAFENFPLKPNDLRRALSPWKNLQRFAEQLIERFPPLVPGFIRIPFESGKVNLTLIFGDAEIATRSLDSPFDVWFLDGFSPQKNPTLWSSDIFSAIARLSQEGTTCSTYSAAGFVRRGLEENGFVVDKISGFGEKRESLVGRYSAPKSQSSILPPWKRVPHCSHSRTQEIAIIGAGLAGFACAHALCKRGFQVTIVERSDTGLAGASGNKAGIFTPYIARQRTPATDFYLPSFLFSRAVIHDLENDTDRVILHRCGALQIPHTDRLRKLLEELNSLGLDPQILSRTEHQGIQCLSFPLAGWISPRDLCEAITRRWHSQLTILYGSEITDLCYQDTIWQMTTAKQESITASAIILCSAYEASRFKQTDWLPLEAIRGELVTLTASERSKQQKQIVMGKGYLLPANDGCHVVGADYAHQRYDLTADPAVHTQLTAQAQKLLAGLSETHVVESRASFRTSTHNRLPLIGPVADAESFNTIFADLQKGYPANHYQMPNYHRSLYVSAGHGSRGLVSTLAAGELLADYIDGTTPLFPAPLCGELNPSSYLTQRLQRRKI